MDFKVQTNARKTCRTCLRVLESRKDLISMFDVDQTFSTKLKYSEMLASISSLLVTEHDELPKRVCIICLQQIRGAFFFKTQAENAYKELTKLHESRNLIPNEDIKREATTANRLLSDIEKLPEVTLTIAPRTICNSRDESLDDMLVEIEPPRLQERPATYPVNTPEAIEDDAEDSDEETIIDYEPDFSDHSNDPDDQIEVDLNSVENGSSTNSKETSGKSPDSGITDDRSKSIEFNERQLAECQSSDLKQFMCSICEKQMISWKALLRHKRNYHSENRCKYCRKRCGTSFHLRMHVKLDHADKFNEFRLNGQTANVIIEPLPAAPACDTCDAKFFNREALLLHHADCDKKCIECGIKIPQRNFYFVHLEKEHNLKLKRNTNLECPFGCSDNFSSEKVLLEHVQRCHPEDRDEGSTADNISEEAESVSNDSFIFQCQHCEARFSKQRSLTSHTSIMHKTQEVLPKTQNVCKYTREEFMEKFMVTKSNEYIRCIPCKKDINRRSLGCHLRGKHASQKSYRCELCPESFFRTDYRMRHMTYSHINDYRCKECDVHFDRAYKIDAHMVKHGIPAKNFKPDERLDPYDLLTDNMKFIEDSSTYDYSKQPMQRRMSVFGSSTGPSEIPLTKDDFVEKYIPNISEKQANCTICQQKMMKGSIISHLMWKHALVKPLKCAFCNERAVKNNLRLSHMNRCHPDEYRCFDCDEQFAKHAQYAEHMLEDHKFKVKTQPSSGEEEDLLVGDLRFISQKNEEEIIEEPEVISLEVETPFTYECKICVKSFTTYRNLKLHNSHKHKGTSAEASAEEVTENTDPMTFEEFRHNYAEIVGETLIKCLVCDQTIRKKNFVNHAKSRHATAGAFRCAVCPEAFFRPEHRIQHMSKSHRGMYFCQSCNIQFYRNSRYAKHMKDQHDIEVDNSDQYEVDLALTDLRFVPYITKNQEEEANSSLPSIVHELEDEQEPEPQQVQSNEEEFKRDEFMAKFMKVVNKETRRCLACDKTMLKGSIYNHLMTYHAKTYLFKCPFCDVRLERAPTRIRHLQIFHPDDYKCQDCGIQFQKHSQFVDHMMEEHNFEVTTPKAPGEEKDLSSLDIMYIVKRPSEDNNEVEESNSSFESSASKRTSRRFSTFVSNSNDKFLKPKIKEESKRPEYFMHSIFGDSNSLLEEKSDKVNINSGESSSQANYNYADFKIRFVVDHDQANVKCLPCNRLVIKTSVCAHLRLHHSIVMSYNCELCTEGFQRSDYRMRHMKHSHPDDFKCTHCNTQFYRSKLFQEHMKSYHKMNYNVPELKTKEEVDVALETMRFVEHLPEALKLASLPIRKYGRQKNLEAQPLNPGGGGLTFKEFKDQYVEAVGDDLKCMICETLFSRYTIKRHLRRCHATSHSFFCELCDDGFQKQDKRMKHMETNHPSDFKCIHCNVQFYYSLDYAEHMQNTHKVKLQLSAAKKKDEVDVAIERLRFVPEQLGTDNYEPSLKSKGLNLKKPKKTFNEIPDDIELTREQFFGKFYRSIKPLTKGPHELKTKCLACFKIFSSKNRYFHAAHNHATTRQWNCEICRKGFFASNKRARHMKNKHPTDFHCSVCDVQFDRGYVYANHMLEDHGETVDIPTVNNDEINIPANLMKFTKKSTAVRTLKKEQEKASTSMDSFLQRGPKKCTVCDLIFDSTREYRMHQRKHLNGQEEIFEPLIVPAEKPKVEPTHECDLCGKKFLTGLARNAHKKFKHMEKTGNILKKRKGEKFRFDVDCEICSFTSHRRDYVEHHVKVNHKTEFDCPFCYRILSNYNLYMLHVKDNHKSQEDVQRKFVCSECDKGFRAEENLKLHMDNKHGDNYKQPARFCSPCGVFFRSDTGFEIHKQNYYHLHMIKFLKGSESGHQVGDEEASSVRIKQEPEEVTQVLTENLHDTDDISDPFTKMLESKLEETRELPAKRFKPSESLVQAEFDEDKLDYLQYLQCVGDVFKCGICGKEKKFRKHMLQHLKQHNEIPTYGCTECGEKFVFKKKYVKHLEMHTDSKAQRIEMNVDEHPKYQEVSKEDSNQIKCQICDIPFKLKIMLNRHNSSWHNDENPDRLLSMNEQKSKKEEIVVIKLLKCKHCLEAFIKPAELKEHLKTKHESNSIEAPEVVDDDDGEESESTSRQATGEGGSFACDKCKLSFNEKKFLENHQTFFCINRRTDQVINEQ